MNKIFYFIVIVLLSSAVAMDIEVITNPKPISRETESHQPVKSGSKTVHFAYEERDETWVGKGFQRIGDNTGLTAIMVQNAMFHRESLLYFDHKSESYYGMMDSLQDLSFFTKLITLDPASAKLTGLTTTQYVLANYTLETTLEEMKTHIDFFLHARAEVTNYFMEQGIEDPSTLEYLDELNKLYRCYRVTLTLLPSLAEQSMDYIFSIMASWDKIFGQALTNLAALGLHPSTPYSKQDTFERILKNEMLCLYRSYNRLSSSSGPCFHKSDFFNSFKGASSARTAYPSLSRRG